jgi:hypothetical protein
MIPFIWSVQLPYFPSLLSLVANARFFGGTADEESEHDASNWTGSTEAYTKNNIASLTFSTGLAWQMQ